MSLAGGLTDTGPKRFFFFFFFLAIWKGLGGCERSCWWGGQGVIVLEKEGFFAQYFQKLKGGRGGVIMHAEKLRVLKVCFLLVLR